MNKPILTDRAKEIYEKITKVRKQCISLYLDAQFGRVMRIESDMMHESLKFGFRHSLPDLFTNGGEKIMALSRYEMILEKSLYKACNELFRLQGIRQGVPVLPSLSVDVSLSQ